MEELKKYETAMVDILKKEKGVNADFMCFPELYQLFVDTGLLDKYPMIEAVKQLINNESVSDSGKEIILKTIFDTVMIPD
ncbi:MAG: hypothetical protein IJ809_01275 [Clostridia bacterium]|nr:hypothetical protein [Clostridia bacterium]